MPTDEHDRDRPQNSPRDDDAFQERRPGRPDDVDDGRRPRREDDERRGQRGRDDFEDRGRVRRDDDGHGRRFEDDNGRGRRMEDDDDRGRRRYEDDDDYRRRRRRDYDDDYRPADIGQDAGIRMLLPVGRSGWAIASGYLGLLSVLLLPGPPALFCGIMAIFHMRRNPKAHGMGRAIFGIIMGGIATIILAVILIAAAINATAVRR